MPKPIRKKYYWDTSIFIAWLNAGKGHAAEVMAGIDEIAAEIQDNKAVLCTSVNTTTEILQGQLTSEQSSRLENLFKRRNVIRINVDDRIATRASQIRNYYNERGVKIATPDAQHLATAIIHGVDEFHTLDGDSKRPRKSDLLSLNGNVAGYPLVIKVPMPTTKPQLQLPLTEASETQVQATPDKDGEDAKKKAAKLVPAKIQRSSDGLAENKTAAEGSVKREKSVGEKEAK